MKVVFFIIGLLGMIFKFLYVLVSEIYFLILDLFNFLITKIIELFWFLVKLGRRILDKPYIPSDPTKKVRKRRK